MTRTLARQKFRLDQVGADQLWRRDKGGPYRRFDPTAEQALRARFAELGRDRFWEL